MMSTKVRTNVLCYPLRIMKYFNSMLGEAKFDVMTNIFVRHRVVMSLKFYMVVDADFPCMP
jgi:hypothetical protein